MKSTQKGFSLIELMVVVAIIGILATVAVPQVNKFMAKAKQAEAKSTLSALYTAEKAFYTEYNTYWATFQTIGFSPEGRVRYVGGFASAGTAACPPALTATCSVGQIDIAAYCGANATVCSVSPEGVAAAAGWGGTSDPSATTFTAVVGSQIISGTNDTWSVDQSKMFQQTSNGIP